MAIEVVLSPRALQDKETLTVKVKGAEQLAGETAWLILGRTDTISTGWLGVHLEIGNDGAGEAHLANVSLRRESAISAVAIEARGERYAVGASNVSVVNPRSPVRTADDAEQRRGALMRVQEERYGAGLGDSTAEGAREHRVLCAVERLLVTGRIRFPGVEIFPVTHRPRGEEQRSMIDTLLDQIGWPSEIDAKGWADHIADNRPWTAIVCAPVWAPSIEDAAALAWRARDQAITVLGLNRGARGRSMATVVQQRQLDNSLRQRVYVDDASSGGNLLGGFIAGEDQGMLAVHQAAMQADPLLRMCVDLYVEALSDPAVDGRYFRMWSLLDTLSRARIQSEQPVLRLDGSPWPNQPGTTRAPTARVYRLIAEHLQRCGVEEGSFVSPASDLYEAVHVWYARRNATGYYGRFALADPRQAAQPWYELAKRTVAANGRSGRWFRTFERATASVLRWELESVGQRELNDA